MKTITADELEDLKESGEEFVLVDVLGEDHFEEEHIPGALNIPLERIASEALSRFDKDEKIVVYCADDECSASPKAAEKLEDLGFENVIDFEAGVDGWKKSGHEVESGMKTEV
ncbi:rhodanese-like domain-containing protein [Halorutilales archaeon Cl-col2-1]